jgi:hypothetical protein
VEAPRIDCFSKKCRKTLFEFLFVCFGTLKQADLELDLQPMLSSNP